MKKIITSLLSVSMLFSYMPVSTYAMVEDDVRGVWVASVYNIDFPSVENVDNVEMQKAEIDAKMLEYKELGLNTVYFQVRPKGDALYESELNPWSDVLTGTQGENPGYDPLEYAIESAHRNGLELHAWLNPYRITTKGTDVSVLADDNIAKINSHWLIAHNDALYLNPALEEVQNHIAETVKEIVDNYNVDGIHFDDYFYPTGYPLMSDDKDGPEADQRREDVNNLVEKVSQVMDVHGGDKEFGISPMGVYKNVDGEFIGGESYYSVYGDTLAWIENEWIDYVVPQVYWEFDHSVAPYENVVNWWNEQIEGTDVKLYIGEAIYKDVVASEIKEHLEMSDKYENIEGHVFYNSKDLLNNKGDSYNSVKNYYDNKDGENSTEEPDVVIEEVLSTKTDSVVLVNGTPINFQAYNINDYNYFKLRDIAFVLNGTNNQFNTVWNESTQNIVLELGEMYEVAGGELTQSDSEKNKIATTSTAKVSIDSAVNEYIDCEAYNIDGNNYFKLRDLAEIIGFEVSWNENTQEIGINTK